MPVNTKELQLMENGASLSVGGAVQKHWSLKTNDTATAVQADGYFDGCGVDAGDLIYATVNMGGATPSFRLYGVTVGGGDVTVVTVAQNT